MTLPVDQNRDNQDGVVDNASILSPNGPRRERGEAPEDRRYCVEALPIGSDLARYSTSVMPWRARAR